MLILSFGCLRFLRESCLLYAFLLGYLPSIFWTFSAKPIDFYLQDCLSMFFYLRICYVVGLYFNHNRQNGQQVSISIILAFLFCLGYYINAKGGVSQC